MITVINLKSILIPTKRVLNNTSKLLITTTNKRFQTTESQKIEIDSTKTTTSEQTKSTTSDYYDVVICGGGMVGTAMARALGKDSIFKNLKIALIESSPKKNDYTKPEIHSNRVCALNDKTIDLLKSLDSFDYIQNNRYGSVKHMHVWDGSSDSFITFHGTNNDNLALIVENDLIQASLSHNLNKYENVNVFYSSEIKDFKSNINNVDIKLKDGKELSTKLLIGSDGANSFIRNKSDFKITKWDYDQVAIVATVKLAEKQQNESFWQRFLPTGPIALYPLNDEYSSLIWSMKRSHANDFFSLSDEKLANEINHAFIREDYKNTIGAKIEETLHGVFDLIRDSNLVPQLNEVVSNREPHPLPPKIQTCISASRGSYPLSFLHANNYIQNRIVLIGDAAHRLHPTSGQGVTFGFGVGVCDNLGFGDVTCLTQVLKDNLLNGGDLGSKVYLEKYESKRQSEVFYRAMGVDFMARLYTDIDYPVRTPIVAARTIGLTVSHRFLPLKNFYIKHALKRSQ